MNNSKIYFYGGVGSVTGANFIFENSKTNERLMIDCGLVQGGKFAEQINREPFKYNPKEVKALLVTHAHIDHIGRIPKLVKDGFRGEIWSTRETKAIARYMFEDAIKVMSYEAEDDGDIPLYEREDYEKALSLWRVEDYEKEFEPISGVKVKMRDAGHILGSVMYEIFDGKNKIIFTGDLGNSPSPLLRDTEEIKQADYLVMESVYGDRDHENIEHRKEMFLEALKKGIERGGTILIPTFSLEKTQVILHEINEFVESGKMESVPVFLDSPLAISITGIYKESKHLFNKKAQARIASGDDLFNFPKLQLTRKAWQSNKIFDIGDPKIILAGSGMSSGGRILKHEKLYLSNDRNTIIFLGFQTSGTLGRKISEGVKKIKIDKEEIIVRAKVVSISGYSSHKGGSDLLEFVSKIKGLKKVFVSMGEPKSSHFLANRIKDYLNIPAVVPEEGEVVELI